jgi:hypothetical protein
MMRNNFLLLSLLLTASAYAQDCTGLKENEEYRLDKNDGPLSKAMIQDQDGVGTCYANTTSLALQSVLPGNPNISYLQLAFAHAQVDVAPKNKDRDSAFTTPAKDEVLINGGQVCDTIAAAKNEKIGGVCLRSDVALEQSIFNSQTNSQKDSLSIQNRMIDVVSKYYDSVKEKFGVGTDIPKKEIANRVLEFSNFKGAFENLLKDKQEKYGKEACLKPDAANVKDVFKNVAIRNYVDIKNKYGSFNLSKIPSNIKGKSNPDYLFYLYNTDMGFVYGNSSNPNELNVRLSDKFSNALEKDYMNNLSATPAPADAISALKSALLKNTDKRYISSVERIINELSPEEKQGLDKDYKRYVQKDVSDCLQKNALAYYKSDDGLIKDFAGDTCLKSYMVQGKNLQLLATVLDQANLKNIDALTNFMNKLPSMNYEEAMRAIVAPDCSNDKKIKIPKNLTCESNNFDYIYFLKNKIASDTKYSYDDIEKATKTEEGNVKAEIEEGYPAQIATIQKKYEGKTDSYSQNQLKTDLQNAEIEKNNRLLRAHDIAASRIPKKLLGDKEQKYWDEYYGNKKKEFNSDAVNLLKNQKTVVPITLCTRMFTNPGAQALRDGRCEQDSADNNYMSVGGYHAMGVIGVRCQKGKLNYLIQNSWGDWDSIKDAKNSDGSQHYEHEFGKAWMTDEEMMSNSYGYQKISK